MADFYDEVLSHIPRATAGERRAIRAELEGHVEDRTEVLEAAGYDRAEAQSRSLAALGDPAEIGRALNAQLSPFWLWLGRAAVVVLVLFGYVLLHLGMAGLIDLMDYHEPGPVQTIREQLAIRRGALPEVEPGGEAAYFWRSGQEMQLGENLVRLEAVELVPIVEGTEVYQGRFIFCVYHRDLWQEAAQGFLEYLTVTTETGSTEAEGLGWDKGYQAEGWFKSYRVWVCEALVVPEDTYVDVRCDCYGLQGQMRCPLRWKEGAL